MTDPNGNVLTPEEIKQIQEQLGDNAKDYIWYDND